MSLSTISIIQYFNLKGRKDALFDVLFDFCLLQHSTTASRLDHLHNQLRMRNGLATLHDTHNRRLRFVVSVCRHSLVGRLVFFLGFFELNLVDFDAHLGVLKGAVVGKFVGVVDIFAFGFLGEHSILGAC